ncbi:hypothetical protein KIPB_007671 [Kipferlia bialata]|uniref:Uncharacterized protein n=1 Tax=Kipferlia bialata TaxID=797122 RepID=A0A9K3GKV5_9EUKA|nr:hypothetical protein KIPB_007671 [Kipferlia bialata]|eukprot:g7671.t1
MAKASSKELFARLLSTLDAEAREEDFEAQRAEEEERALRMQRRRAQQLKAARQVKARDYDNLDQRELLQAVKALQKQVNVLTRATIQGKGPVVVTASQKKAMARPPQVNYQANARKNRTTERQTPAKKAVVVRFKGDKGVVAAPKQAKRTITVNFTRKASSGAGKGRGSVKKRN